MKNNKLLIFILLFTIATVLICFNGKESYYKKKIHFNTPEEIIEVLNSEILYAKEKTYKNTCIPTDEFSECLSIRKRIAGEIISLKSINVEKVLNDNEYEIKKDYLECIDRLKGYDPGDNLEVRTIEGTALTNDNEKRNITLNIVFIDEGEGYVIDYIKCKFDVDSDDKNHDYGYIIS